MLKLSSKSQECCLAKICSCWSGTADTQTWFEHRAGSTQSLQGASPAGWMSRGTSRWFSSKSARSEWKCTVERHLWVPYSSLLLEAGEGAASRTRLATASCRGNVLCREEKTCSSCQKGSSVLCASAAALQCPLHVPLQECPGWGFWDCQAASSPALAEVLTGACPQCLPLSGKEVFLGMESLIGNWGGHCRIPTFGQTDGAKRKTRLFASFVTLTEW